MVSPEAPEWLELPTDTVYWMVRPPDNSKVKIEPADSRRQASVEEIDDFAEPAQEALRKQIEDIRSGAPAIEYPTIYLDGRLSHSYPLPRQKFAAQFKLLPEQSEPARGPESELAPDRVSVLGRLATYFRRKQQ